MKKDKLCRIFDVVVAGVLLFSLVLLVKSIVDYKAQAQDVTEAVETVYIVYTDEQSHPYAVLTNPRIFDRVEPLFVLTDADRETVAQIVAGQAVDCNLTCQTMIANVLYNQMLTTGGRIAGTDYAKCTRRTPTERTYEAVDAIFTRGEWLLDDTVLWTGDAENPDAWHQTLRLVTTCDGVAFYKAHRPNVVPGGAAE